jgi:hypothetical protein
MSASKPKRSDTFYSMKPDADVPDEDEDDEDEKTEVTKLHDLLEERLAHSRKKLNGVARKGDALKRRLVRPGSVQKMQAVLSDPPANKESP